VAYRPILAGGASSEPCGSGGRVLRVGAADAELGVTLSADILEESAGGASRRYGA
jgi:hypothetical protein